MLLHPQGDTPCRHAITHYATLRSYDASHVPDDNWHFKSHLQALRQQGRSWRDMYWFTWGLVVFLYCQECQAKFPIRQLGHCLYHSQLPHLGVHACCNRPLWRPGLHLTDCMGCSTKQHNVLVPRTDKSFPPPRFSDQPGVYNVYAMESRAYINNALTLAKAYGGLFSVAFDPETAAPPRPHKPLPLLLAVLQDVQQQQGVRGPSVLKYQGLGEQEVAQVKTYNLSPKF